MIVFDKIRWKNFLSTGNNFTEIDLTESRSTLVIGTNGAGKSTILDALCFALFNKPFRKINKPQLVNTINERECQVEVEFHIGSTSYKVVRGIKPGLFQIFRNDSLIDQDAANRDYQKYLEQSILKFNFKSFTQVVILGSSTFVPFMQLPAAHRREVIEDLLDIGIFSQMNTILKDRVKDTKESIKNCEHEYALAESKVDMQRHSISSLEDMKIEHIKIMQDRFDQNEKRSIENVQRISDINNNIKQLQDSVVDVKSLEENYASMREMRAKIQQNLNKATKEIEFYEKNDTCPTCDQTLSQEHKDKHLCESRKRFDKFTTGVDGITATIGKTVGKIRTAQATLKEIQSMQHEIQSYQKENNKILKDNTKIMEEVNKETPDLQKEKDKLDVYEKELVATQHRCSEVNLEFENLKIVSNLLKDGGIKSKIISKFIPIINQRINKYLSEMDFFVNFTLDEEFNEVIKSRYRDEFSYASFSEGEKQKIDLALLFTWRDIAKLKNSTSTNLLLLDEVFDSSLDTSSTDELLKILKGLSSETNLFVISHKGEVLLDKFERTLKFSKVNDFSKVTNE